MGSLVDLADRPYIKYSDDVEHKQENEDEDIQAVADQINLIQKAQWDIHRHCYTGAQQILPFALYDNH